MADINIGGNDLLTTSLETNDRITITRAATGQQIATMTVGDLLASLREKLPVAPTSEAPFGEYTDCNSYTWPSNVRSYFWKNAPVDSSYGYLQTLGYNYWVVQMFFDNRGVASYQNIYVRFYNGSNQSWSAWRAMLV